MIKRDEQKAKKKRSSKQSGWDLVRRCSIVAELSSGPNGVENKAEFTTGKRKRNRKGTAIRDRTVQDDSKARTPEALFFTRQKWLRVQGVGYRSAPQTAPASSPSPRMANSSIIIINRTLTFMLNPAEGRLLSCGSSGGSGSGSSHRIVIERKDHFRRFVAVCVVCFTKGKDRSRTAIDFCSF